MIKQKIFYYSVYSSDMLGWEQKDKVEEFCKQNDFLFQWKKKDLKQLGHWQIGIFETEHYRDEVDMIINFGLQYSANTSEKITLKSGNDVRARTRLLTLNIAMLRAFDHELKLENKRINKKNPEFKIESLLNKDDIDEIEKEYRWNFTEEELDKITISILKYKHKFPYLRAYFSKFN